VGELGVADGEWRQRKKAKKSARYSLFAIRYSPTTATDRKFRIRRNIGRHYSTSGIRSTAGQSPADAVRCALAPPPRRIWCMAGNGDPATNWDPVHSFFDGRSWRR
jgi:hypothetical protein